MKEQKFNVGDLVRLEYGHLLTTVSNGETKVIDVDPNRANELAVILYTYNQKYGDATTPDNRYGVIMLETGSEWAWMSDGQADLVESNCGFKYITQARENQKKPWNIEWEEVEVVGVTPKKLGEGKGWSVEGKPKGDWKAYDQLVNLEWEHFVCVDGEKFLSAQYYDTKEEAEKAITNLRNINYSK